MELGFKSGFRLFNVPSFQRATGQDAVSETAFNAAQIKAECSTSTTSKK
jgi:hypothetical protein